MSREGCEGGEEKIPYANFAFFPRNCPPHFASWFYPRFYVLMSAAIFMEDTNSLIEQRKAKLAALRAKGIDPFQNKFTGLDPTGATKEPAKCDEVREHFLKWVANPNDTEGLAENTLVYVAGRITAHRDMGKSMFIDVRDQSGRIQCYAQKNTLGDDLFHTFTHLDLGDFVGVKGTLFLTKTKEPSIKLESFTILAKALRPPPAKWHGLEDTEIRYRQRYLDLIANPDVKKIFLQRSEIVHEIRQFFHARGYVEVETPAMQAIPGGAAAQPFKTFHNALGCEFYLRIALELYHKRLLVGGIDKLFEIGKNFRNEGLSRRHNPEFTMLEAYCAFGDYKSMMTLVREMICEVSMKIFKTLVLPRGRFVGELNTNLKIALGLLQEHIPAAISTNLIPAGEEVRSKITEWLKNTDSILFWQTAPEIFNQLIPVKKQINLTDENHSLLNAVTSDGKSGLDYVHLAIKQIEHIAEYSTSKCFDLRKWEEKKYNDLIKEKAGADWFDVTPEARRQRAHDMGAEIGKEFEDFEVTNAVFSKFIEPTLIQPTFVTHLPKELVPLAKLSPDDPTTVEVFECCINGQEISPGYTEQNDPIAQRATLEHQAGGEQQKLDEDFLVALEHGMPPAGGIGIGIDRLCMMLLGQESIRDVILFPQLKPK
jgi:lysyl-tRNA synthetase class 2